VVLSKMYGSSERLRTTELKVTIIIKVTALKIERVSQDIQDWNTAYL
jgi:hypothetical protein